MNMPHETFGTMRFTRQLKYEATAHSMSMHFNFRAGFDIEAAIISPNVLRHMRWPVPPAGVLPVLCAVDKRIP
jgi:hypothetical protein